MKKRLATREGYPFRLLNHETKIISKSYSNAFFRFSNTQTDLESRTGKCSIAILNYQRVYAERDSR